MCIGGPALIYYVTPTEEELFKVNSLDFVLAVLTDAFTSATIRNCNDDLLRIAKASKKTLTTLWAN